MEYMCFIDRDGKKIRRNDIYEHTVIPRKGEDVVFGKLILTVKNIEHNYDDNTIYVYFS